VSDAASQRPVVQAGKAPTIRREDDEIAPQLRRAASLTEVVRVRDRNDSTRLIFGAHVLVGNRVVGELRLSLSTRELHEALARSLAQAQLLARASVERQLLFAGLLLVVGLLLGGFQARRMTGQLRELSAQAKHIAAGDFDRRVEVTSTDEIGELARSFNTMTESLGHLVVEMAGKASMERELELARNVQSLMSPGDAVTRLEHFTIAGMCSMAEECGGDWWTYRALHGDRLLLIVGDVTGHGLPAAMIAATARGSVQALALVDEKVLTPIDVLEAMDCAIRDIGQTNLLMTSCALLLDPGRGRIDFANAGHCFPYLLRADQHGNLGYRPLAVRGNPLGSARRLVNAGSEPLHDGDALVLTTDGLTDRITAGGMRFGDRRLRNLLVERPLTDDGSGVIQLRNHIADAVTSFAGNTPADDDLTLVICQYHARVEQRVAMGGPRS
jgi:HAMP domain-containing protein